MSRFLSRAGTNIDDLERQLARVGSNENENSADESNLQASTSKGQPTESTALLGLGGASSDSAGQYAHGCMHTDAADTLSKAWREGEHHHRSGGAVAARKLGTWDGVFMPVTLSIWGILVYVRMGYFLSQVGIVGTVLSFVCGYLTTTMTTLSISAISTNGTVKGGGPYYMLSRSLGPEFGGSIGLMFYAGTLLSAVLNTVAFVEPLLKNFGQETGGVSHAFPEGTNWHILYSSVLFTFCTIVCLTGAQMFARASTVLSTFIIASTGMIMASFAIRQPFIDKEKSVYYTSWSLDTFRENLWPDLSPIAEGRPSETLGSVLGVLFPACIGIMAGASMSSSLRKPSKSIPKGTLWAVLLTFVLYMAIVLCLGATTRRVTLRENFNVLQDINVLPIVVPVGAIITSVTSTLSGVLSAASVLQAIAKDDLFAFMRPLKQRAGSDGMTRAILTTYAFGQMAFFVGDTNAVAPFTTMFNLIMFAFVNLACLVLKLAASVNFRPTFHYFKAWTACLGALGCFTIMCVVDVVSALVSTGVVTVLFLYVHYTCPPKPWGDVTQSLIYHQCRKYMLRLDLRKDHVKFWRPQILLLVHNPRSSLQLIRFCNALKKGGLYVIGHVIKGEFHEMLPEYRKQEAAWLKLVDELRVKAFVNLTVARSDDQGARSIAFGAGLGGMRPNIVVLGFLNRRQEERISAEPLPTDGIKLNEPIDSMSYVQIIEDVMAMGKAVGIAYGFSQLSLTAGRPSDTVLPLAGGEKPGHKQYIDLWPIQIGTAAVPDGTAGSHRAYLTNFDSYVMVLQLGTVLHLVPHWNQHFVLRVMCFVEHQQDVAEEYRRVAKLLRDLRVDAELHVHYLQGSDLQTYDGARTQAAAKTPTNALPPNAKPMDISATDAVPSTPSTGFSMRVNLPMPARYEARRFDTNNTSTSATAASNSSSTSCSTTSSSEDSDSSDSDTQGSLVSRQRNSQRPRKHRLHLMSNLFDGSGNTRRRSDGSMVLSNFYSQTFASLRRNRQPDSSKKGKRKSQHNLLQAAADTVLEFNDMSLQTQNSILNELMHRHSRQGTRLIFTTLQAPEPGTLGSKDKADEYLDHIDALARGLPPVFLVHATSLTVTTSL
ncbi:hypothetical protein LPJ78_000971 [Coemansia sp. RSA 989]|nr:amino acid permease-domain-containing protein [Coemansia mojavensis]KAJ1739193.1 hypothetical protein LPJ68_004897 [Coemansia sp. RSA 1086]KAJ1747875.1 hypothetical protein LPJ79_004947 [Coemansia sp. RSA 1821]KAJ1867415.1 hypothetical protein LPJ78_000971 [Coemansia sp. RSA 989]KAJ1874929.1 hypothetical protein LPJ55_001143 [Coemansia sp. RSA 990]